MMQELLAWTSRDLQGILRHLDAVEAGSIEPFPPLLRRRPLRDIGFEASALREQPQRRHLLIDPTPQGIEGAKGWKGQDHLAAQIQVSR